MTRDSDDSNVHQSQKRSPAFQQIHHHSLRFSHRLSTLSTCRGGAMTPTVLVDMPWNWTDHIPSSAYALHSNASLCERTAYCKSISGRLQCWKLSSLAPSRKTGLFLRPQSFCVSFCVGYINPIHLVWISHKNQYSPPLLQTM